MKPTIVNHPLRVINLKYNSDADLSEMENKALEEYIYLHDELFRLKENQTTMVQSLGKLEKTLYYLEEERETLCESVKKCGPMAGYTKEECDRLVITECEIDVKSLISDVLEHQRKMNENHEDCCALRELLIAWEDDSEAFEVRWDLFRDNHVYAIMQQWEQMEIDIVSLDIDTESFYDVCRQLLYPADSDDFRESWDRYAARYGDYVKLINELFPHVDKLSQTANDFIVQQRTGFRMN